MPPKFGGIESSATAQAALGREELRLRKKEARQERSSSDRLFALGVANTALQGIFGGVRSGVDISRAVQDARALRADQEQRAVENQFKERELEMESRRNLIAAGIDPDQVRRQNQLRQEQMADAVQQYVQEQALLGIRGQQDQALLDRRIAGEEATAKIQRGTDLERARLQRETDIERSRLQEQGDLQAFEQSKELEMLRASLNPDRAPRPNELQLGEAAVRREKIAAAAAAGLLSPEEEAASINRIAALAETPDDTSQQARIRNLERLGNELVLRGMVGGIDVDAYKGLPQEERLPLALTAFDPTRLRASLPGVSSDLRSRKPAADLLLEGLKISPDAFEAIAEALERAERLPQAGIADRELSVTAAANFLGLPVAADGVVQQELLLRRAAAILKKRKERDRAARGR